MKKILLLMFVLLITNYIFSLNDKYTIIEKKGIVDIMNKSGISKPAQLNSEVLDDSEIFTGFHSMLTIEINKDSYLVINQLSNVIIEPEIENENETIFNLTL